MRYTLPALALVTTLVVLAVSFFFPLMLWSFVVLGPVLLIGTCDFFQQRHSILRNFPFLGHFRYFAEFLRPPVAQYFIESDTDGVPFAREERSVVYARAKRDLDTVPFGTKHDLYEVGYEWVNHSLAPTSIDRHAMRVDVGGPDCKHEYSASLLNVSAMSFGALSANAIRALNAGAKMGGFAHNTGEGGLTSYHLDGGGDLIWQIGTGYFGCRDEIGHFDPDRFAKSARLDNVKMIEIKLSQGAKPGHGGILPAAKLTQEIAEIRGVPMGHDVISPPAHSAFSTPRGLMEYVAHLRDLSDGKPIGFKLCIGRPTEFMAICKAMVETNITPDFITVDGGEGGTGAAPLEFSNHIGTPLVEGLLWVHNSLVGFGVRDRIRVFASGRITTGFGVVKRLALGADACYSARGMMMALGCIQALRCNANDCPVGVATQKKHLAAGLVPAQKSERVRNFHDETIESAREILGAMGIDNPSDVKPWHILRRTSPTNIQSYSSIYEFVDEGQFLSDDIPERYRRAWQAASPDTFQAQR